EVNGEAGPRKELRREQDRERHEERDHPDTEPERQGAEARDEERPRRMPPQDDDSAEYETRTKHRKNHAVGRRAAVVLLHHERCEHTPRLAGEVADSEEHDRVEDPALPSELGPAVAQLAQERLRLDGVGAACDVDAREYDR